MQKLLNMTYSKTLAVVEQQSNIEPFIAAHDCGETIQFYIHGEFVFDELKANTNVEFLEYVMGDTKAMRIKDAA